uniref:Golgin B1 n=1 Tax=Lepisosteus oculatus TaxID=7918 RepID=W5MDC2_LEPOC
MSSQSVADITEQLAQTEQLVVQLKELIREKDNVLRTKDEQLKTEKEAWEAKLSKMKLQNKAKVTSLNSQLEELKKQLPSSGAKETKSDIRKASGDGDQEHAAASRGKILVLKKKVEELELQLSQKEADLEETRELADQRQRGAEMDGMLAERDKKLQEKEAYIVDLQDLQVLVQNLTKKVGENIILEKDNKLVEINQMHEQELFRLAAKSDASADLEQLLKALKQKLHEKEEVLLGKTQVIDVLQNEVDARDQQIKELAEKMKRLQGEKDNMLSKLDAEKHKHETELKQVTERHESELSEKHQAYLQLQRQLQEKLEQYEELKMKNDELMAKLVIYEEQQRKMQADLEQEMSYICSKQGTLQQEQINILNSQLDQLKCDIAEKEKVVQDKNAQCQCIQQNQNLNEKEITLNNKSQECQGLLDKINRKDETVTSLSRQLDVTNEELIKLQSENVNLKTTLDNTIADCKLLKEDTVQSKNEVMELQKQVQALNEQNAKLEIEIKEAAVVLSETLKEIGDLQSELSSRESSIVFLKEEVVGINSERLSLNVALQEKIEALNQQEIFIKQLQTKSIEGEGQLSQNMIQKSLVDLGEDFNLKLKAKETECGTFKEQITDLQESVAKLNEKISTQSSEVQTLNESLEQREADLQSLKREHSEQVDHIDLLKSEILDLNQKNKKMREEAEQNYNSQLQTMKNEMDFINKQHVSNMSEAAEQLTTEKELLQMQVSAKIEEIIGLKLETRNIEHTLQESEKEWLSILDRETQLKNLLTEQLRSLENEMKSKDVKVQALQKDLDTLQEKFNEVTSALKISTEQLKESCQQIAVDKHQLENVFAAIQRKDGEISELQQHLRDREDEVKMLEIDKESSNKNLFEISQSMSDKLVAFEEEKKYLQATIKQIKDQIKNLQKDMDAAATDLKEAVTEHEYHLGVIKKKEDQIQCMNIQIKKELMQVQYEKLSKDKEIMKKKLQAALLVRKDLIKKVEELEKQREGGDQQDKEMSELQDQLKESLLEQLEHNVQCLQRKLSEQETDIFPALQSINEKDKVIEHLQYSISEKEESYNSERAEMIKKLENLRAELLKKEESIQLIDSVNSNIEQVDSMASEDTELTQIKQEKDILQKKLHAALLARKETIKKSQEKERKHANELSDLKEEFNKLMEQYSEQTHELNAMQKKYDEKIKESEDNLQVIASLQSQLSSISNVVNEKEKALQEFDLLLKEHEMSEQAALQNQGELETLKKKIEVMTSEMAGKEILLQTIQDRSKVLTQKIEQIEQELEKAHFEIIALENVKREKECQLEDLKELEKAHKIHSEKLKELQDMKNILAETQHNFSQEKECLKDLKARLQDKEGILLSLKLTISEKDDLIAALEQQLQKELHLHEVEREKMEIEINELQQKSNARQVKEQSEEGKSNNEQITRKLQAALISRKEALKENRTLKEKIQLLSSEKEDIMNTTLSLERSAAEMKRQKEDLELSMLSLSKEKEKLVLEVDQVLSDNHNLAAACESLKLTIENITQQKQAFSCQLESLKDSQTVELSEWKSKHTELKQEYESLLQAYENISSEMDKMRQLIEAARKEKQEVLSKWYKTASEKEILEKQVGEAEEENEKLKDKTRKFAKVKQQRILELEQENEKIKKELLELSEKQVGKAEELSSRNTQLEAENNRLKETYEELLVKLNEMKCANQKVTEELKVMSESLANCHSEYKAKEAEMERKLEETLSLNDLLTLEVETQKAVISAKCECLNVLEKEKCNLSDQLAQLIKDHQEKLEQKDSALAERQGVINRNVQETISLNEKVRILEDDKSLLQEELENVQETSDKVKNENEYLETVLLKNAEKIDELTETVNTLQVQNKSLSAQLIEIKQEKNEFCRQKEDQQLKLVKEFEEKLRVAQRGSAGSKSINKELQELLKEKHQEINQLQSDCINYQEVILDFERSAKVLQSEHSKVEKELNDTKEKLLNLETIIQNLESEITSYKNLLNESRNEVEKVNSEIVKLHNQLAQKDKLAELQLMEKEKELKELLEQQNTLHKEMLMELEARINTLQLEKEKDEETVFELKKQIESQGIMNSRLQKEANLNLSRLVAVSQSLRNNDEARQWEDKFQKLIQDKDGQLLEQSHAISRLKQDMKVKDALLNELKEKFLKLETALSETDTHYKAAASDYQKQVTIMEENNKELSKNIEDLRKQIGGQSDDIEKLQQDKSSLNLRLTDKLDYVSKMEANLTMLEMKLSNTEAELFLVRSQNDKLVVDLEKQDAISAQLKLLLKNKDAEIALLLSSREISEYLEEVQKHHWAEILGYEDRLSALYSERENADKAFRGLESNVKSLQEKYEKSLQEKEQMNAKLESFKKAMMSLQSDRDHLMSKYEVLQSKLQSIEKEKEILIKEELGETNKLKQEIKALLHQMDDLNSENAMLKAQLIRYREDLNQVLSLKDNQLKELLKQQLDSIKNLENQKNAMDKMYKDVLQNLEKETETTKSLEAKNSELGIQVQTLEANILALKKERQELNQNKVIADLQQAVEVKAAECSELHQKLFAQKSSVEDLKRNLRQLESDMEKKVKETKEKYNNEISAFEREVALMRSIRETAEERVEELTRDLIQTEQLLSEARSQSKELKSHNESLGKAMVALQNDRDQLIEDFKLLRNKYDEELKTASAALNKFEFQLNNMTSEVKMLTKERSALIQKLSAFESDSTYSQLMGQVDDLCKTVTEKEAEIKRLTLENETYSKQMTAFSKSMASLQDDRDRLIQQLGGTKRVYESRQRESSASSSVKSDKELDAFRSNFSELQTEKGSVFTFQVKEMGSQRLENVELTQMKIRVDELQKALQQAYAYRQQTEKDIRAYQSELGELRSEKNLLLSESRALRQQHLMVVAEKDRQISELQKHRPEALVKESKNAPSLYPVKMESVTLAAKEASADQVTQLLKERGQLQSDLQRCLQEIHQKDLRFQQLNAKMMQTIEEKMGLSMQLKAVSQTLRETQMNLSEVQNRCYWLESQTQTPAVLPYQNPVQGAAAVEVPPGAPQEKTMVDIESLDGSELRRRLIETEQALDSTQQDLSHLAEELSEERARREAAEEALGLVAEMLSRVKDIDANISRSTPREYSIQLESDEEHRALIIDPAEHVVVRKRWLRGRSLYCSKLLTTRAKSRYVFLTYLLALHVVVFMCLTGLL